LNGRNRNGDEGGVFFGVANELGSGFLESVYRRAMCLALREAGLRVEEEASLEVWFHGQSVGMFRADIIVEGFVLLELKTAEEITRQFEAQVLHYLRASTVEVGMVLAFGTKARFRRLTRRITASLGWGNRNGAALFCAALRSDEFWDCVRRCLGGLVW
jgi:GxxExxY protein